MRAACSDVTFVWCVSFNAARLGRSFLPACVEDAAAMTPDPRTFSYRVAPSRPKLHGIVTERTREADVL